MEQQPAHTNGTKLPDPGAPGEDPTTVYDNPVAEGEVSQPGTSSVVKRAKRIPLVESFGPTIQGEGGMIGYQTMFLRFGGCDFRCERCDSLHAVLPHLVKEKATYYTQEALTEHSIELMRKGGVPWVTFSGGNPCIWDLSQLVFELKRQKYMIAVETQGTIWQDWLYGVDVVSISPKGPGMGEKFIPQQFDNFLRHLAVNTNYWYVKVVVFDQRDLEFVVSLMNTWGSLLSQRMFLSVGNVNPPGPAKRDHHGSTELGYDALVREMLSNYRLFIQEVMQDPRLRDVRILPQMHALLYGNRQGV